MTEKKIKARVQRERWVYVHNDLSQAATYLADIIKMKVENGQRDGVLLDGMACGTMIAFAFEANVNFMGYELQKSKKLPSWNERWPIRKKLTRVFSALGIPVVLTERPLKSMERVKGLRDKLAHGKPVYVNYDQVEIGTQSELDRFRGKETIAGWEPDCMAGPIFEALEDLDVLWKQMYKKSGLRLWDTITRGQGGLTFIEDVDPNTPSTIIVRSHHSD